MSGTPATNGATIITTAHQGIPLHTVESSRSPGSDAEDQICTGTLFFSVGTQDEPLELLGVTHLVEHMVLGALEQFPLPNGAVVDHESMQFHATGSPADVAAYFEVLTHTIGNFAQLSRRDLARAKTIIKAENPPAYKEFTSGMLTYRFGAQGPGLTHLHTPTLESITWAEATSWAGTWLNTGHAALSFTAQAPAELNVKLPQGARLSRPAHVPTRQSPTLIASPLQGVALSLLVPGSHAPLLADALEYELAQRLRTTDGLICSVEQLIYRLRTSHVSASQSHPAGNVATFEKSTDIEPLCQVDLVFDPLPENTLQVLKRSVLKLRRIAAQGFSANAITFARTVLAANLSFDEHDAANHLDEYTLDHLAGHGTPLRQTARRQFPGTPIKDLSSQLGAALARALPTLLVACDDDAKVSPKTAAALGLECDKFSIWQRNSTRGGRTATVFNLEGADDRLSWVHRRAKETLTLTGTHLMKKKPRKTLFIELASIRLVGVRECGCICLIDEHGRHTEIDTAEFKQSKSLRQGLLASFDRHIIRDFPEL